jgi:hypothetical protein
MANGATTPRITRKPGTIKPPVTQPQWQTWLRNRQQASDRGNWSDGGNWIGFGPEPNAFDTLTAESKTESIQKLYDENKKLVDQKTLSNTQDLRDLPEASLWQLIQAVGNKSGEVTTIACPDASVLVHA